MTRGSAISRTRREQVVEAAMAVVADGGLRALTHRAVDVHAGLPMGSTANVFRNRDAIIEALLGEIEARDLRFFAEARTPADPDGLAGMLARGVVLQASPPHATVTRVRFELLLLRPERLRPGHERLVGVLEDQIAALGTQPSSARAISALLEGALLYAISSDDAGLDQAELTHSIRVLLEPE